MIRQLEVYVSHPHRLARRDGRRLGAVDRSARRHPGHFLGHARRALRLLAHTGRATPQSGQDVSRSPRRSSWPDCGVARPVCAAGARSRRACPRKWPGCRRTERSTAPQPSPVAPREPVIGYVTTSTDAWSDADEASAAAIEATCERSDWGLFEIVQDRQNGKTLDRPGLRYALEQIAEGRARGLVVSDLQRLSRSPDDLAVLIAWFRDADATLVALDLDLDTSTPAGREVARTLMALGKAEQGRRPDGTAIGRADAPAHGRPALKDRPELMERISAMRSANMTLRQIADQFNAEGIPTLRGGSAVAPVEHPGRAGVQATRAARPPAGAGRPRAVTGGNRHVRGSDSNRGHAAAGVRGRWGAIAHPPLHNLWGVMGQSHVRGSESSGTCTNSGCAVVGGDRAPAAEQHSAPAPSPTRCGRAAPPWRRGRWSGQAGVAAGTTSASASLGMSIHARP